MHPLAAFATPTIANALEILGEDPAVGFTDATLRPLSAEGAIFAGRAATATLVTATPAAAGEPRVATEDYWRYVASRPGPTVVVVQDLDPEPAGAMWGEVQARVHRAIGAVGIVTNGAVRDLNELTRLGFPTLGSRACVSHAHARFREVDVPVVVGGITVRPGDFVHADRHGLQLVPSSVDLDELARVCAEIESLEQERADLHAKLRELAERESALRARASRANDLEDERQALEDLLDEALQDVASKDSEIAGLQDRLKNEGKMQAAQSKGRSRESERIAKRFGALYRNLEVDDRAVADLVALGDESQKLRAEEALKRLDDDPDTAAIRRKVGGLPPHLSIFELGFAGKGRIYYMRSERGGYRVLAIGGKATQKQDLEYLSRIG